MADLDIDELIRTTTNGAANNINLISDLTNAWVAERNSPELLPYDQLLLETAKDRLSSRMNDILELGEIDMKMNFTLVILQTEMERLKYLIRSYLRTRISKIDRYALHYLRNDLDATRLSALERHYVAKHQAILERHYRASFLKEFADSGQLRRVDDPAAAGLSMIDAPNMEKSVFCQVVKECDEIVKVGTDQLELSKGATFLVRYSAIRPFLSDNTVVLV